MFLSQDSVLTGTWKSISETITKNDLEVDFHVPISAQNASDKLSALCYNSCMLNTIIIQPPLVQLNTPYPSGAYLQAFFKELYAKNSIQGTVKWLDMSTELFHSVFSRQGLSLIFNKSAEKALSLADRYESQGDDNTAFQLRRYVSQSDQWISWIDTIMAIVCNSNSCNNGNSAAPISGHEFTHEFVRSAYAPRGARMETYLTSLGRDVGVDDSRILASLAFADLADYIKIAYDKNFSLIRYAEHLATSSSSFDEVIKNLNSPVLTDIYEPLLKQNMPQELSLPGAQNLFLISVPFPGCFEAALYTARLLRSLYGSSATIAFGGGYINTELRSITEQRLFNYCDFLSYDKGYGSYIQLFQLAAASGYDLKSALTGSRLYKIRYLYESPENKTLSIIEQSENSETLEKQERDIIHSLIPDFSTIDFTRSPRMADDTNPMHRIWNDGTWLKAYLAYGCYWHRCAFCDTSLDYVNNYCATDTRAFFNGIYAQAVKAGVYGIHFVDEACPPAGLQQFALSNLAASRTGPKLTYWGNIRFEKSFTRDMADLLSCGGLTAVSAGVEIATGTGLDSVNKGIDMENIISACCAFKEAGILVHSYMIFGFWNQSEQDLINSMETLRQMFAAGLLDSAFWHKFSLTKHSTVYREWQQRKHPDLKPLPAPKTQFAENDIHWEGEHKSDRYSEPLNVALELWMHGEKLNKSAETFFPFKMPKPTIAKDFVESKIALYEKKRDKAFNQEPKPDQKFVWLGGRPLILKSSNGAQLCWTYMGELLYADLPAKNAENVRTLLADIAAPNFTRETSASFTARNLLPVLGHPLFKTLRGKGLCQI